MTSPSHTHYQTVTDTVTLCWPDYTTRVETENQMSILTVLQAGRTSEQGVLARVLVRVLSGEAIIVFPKAQRPGMGPPNLLVSGYRWLSLPRRRGGRAARVQDRN